MGRQGPQPDRVDFDLVMELVEMLGGPTEYCHEIALAIGVSTAALARYRTKGVPRYLAEELYDRVAYGLGPHKPQTTTFEYPLDLDERSELARLHYKGAA